MRLLKGMNERRPPRAASDTLHEVPRVQRRAPPHPISWFAETYSDRNQAIAMAYRSNDHSQQDIAAHFGLHYTSVCRIVGKARVADGKC